MNNVETILIPMMDGTKMPHEVTSFECQGIEFSARAISSSLIYILHRATGLKVTAEHTGDVAEAIEGFRIAVDVGGYNISGVAGAAATAPQINATVPA